ncbi:MAG: hypothetical protein AB7N76_10305 [Planctomycetota bacterium]
MRRRRLSGRRLRSWILRSWGLAAAVALGGCATQADIDRAVDEDVRFTGRILGFALDAAIESLQARVALLEAMRGDPRFEELQKRLGSIEDVKAKLERVQAQKRSLMEEHQRLRRRYSQDEVGG